MGLKMYFNKTEFIGINTDQRFHINIEENVIIKQFQNFKYLGLMLNKKGMSSEDIICKIYKEWLKSCLSSL
jgi:hypothetical protein